MDLLRSLRVFISYNPTLSIIGPPLATKSFIVLLRAHHLLFKESVRHKCYAQQILLAARSIYPNLSKLALALEKNLLVTSTLTVCTKPYPQMMPNPEPEKASDEAQPQSNSIQNGVEPMMGDRDEIMKEVEEADIDDMTIDMDAFQEMVGSSEANSTAVENS